VVALSPGAIDQRSLTAITTRAAGAEAGSNPGSKLSATESNSNPGSKLSATESNSEQLRRLYNAEEQ
jgi:hypothetical protein